MSLQWELPFKVYQNVLIEERQYGNAQPLMLATLYKALLW